MHLSSLCHKHMRPLTFDLGDLPVVVLGAGAQGRAMAEYLEKNSISVVAFCETSAYYRPGKIICGKPVYEYETLSGVFPPKSGGYGCHLVFAASGEGVREIWNNPIKTAKKYYLNRDTPVRGKIKMTAEWVNKHIDALDEMYHFLADDASRKVFLSYIDERAHCLKEASPHLFDLYTPGEYFNDFYDFDRYAQHTLVDCGAYTGDSAEKFLDFLRAHGKTGKVFAFEPDEQNMEQLKILAEKLSALGEIRCFPYAAGAERGTLTFATGLGHGSHCIENSSNEKNIIQVSVVTIDDVLRDTKVSMIKMDVEGSELAALKGAKKIISEQMPFLAISVYHRDDDLITIPQFIRGLAQRAGREYKFYLRHHCRFPYIFDTDIYAVPE